MSRKFWAVLSVLLVAILAITACAPVPAQLPARAGESYRGSGAGCRRTRHPDLGLLGQPGGGGEPQSRWPTPS